jgi:2-keto-4-pentenoate hydratase/2-oxohepta-3-ene-1,7-dioic acid hydratase in catechol pathway
MTVNIAIAPVGAALTFARTTGGRIIAVTDYEHSRITAVDLSALTATPEEDPISLFNRLGYGALQAFVEADTQTVEVAAAELGLPADFTTSHIAVGTNYREHAKESAVTGSPFLFPKVVQPTTFSADIPAGKGLLDFEAELCLVPLQPIGLTDEVHGGLILGNDVTDRATLMRRVDLKNPQSGCGFTDGKSGPGFLPVGNLFVIPRDLGSFLAGLTLQLSVNGVERQRAPVTEWIWDLNEIVNRSRAKRDATWTWREGTARLAFNKDGAIPARTLIMAGTPAGTIFQGVPGTDQRNGVLRWILSGFRRSVADHVIAAYIARNAAAKTYLQSGDLVTIEVDYLGSLANRVTA